MGQDTFIDFGVSVSFTCGESNDEIIRTLLNNLAVQYHSFGIRCFVIIDYDEIQYFQDSEYTVEELFEQNKTLHFIIPCAKAYARNISRRERSFIFGSDDCEDPDDVCAKIQSAKQMFLELGVPEFMIWTGYTVMDS